MTNNRFRVSRTLIRRLEELDISPSAVLRRAELPLELLEHDRIVVTTEQLFALYRAIADIAEDPAIGLKLASEERIERWDPIAVAALCARSLRDAVERLGRYKQLTCPETVSMERRGDELAVRFTWTLAREVEPPLLVDLCFAWVVNVARHGVGRTIHPKRVELARPPAHREIYRTHFNCPVRFNAGRNALVFSAADGERPFLTYNPDLLGAVGTHLEAELVAQRARLTLRDEVKGALKRLLSGHPPRLEDVAKEIGLSARTLQRRLTAERASFQGLINDARRELAHHYLLQPSLELDETAYLLGYEDANSFFRAFQRWEGTSPGEWRSARRNASVLVGEA